MYQKTKYPYKETVHTITSDNSSEFAEHEFIAKNQYEFFISAHSFLAKQEKSTRWWN
jgi:IS30 family transposase